MKSKILIIPARRHILEAYYEYIIRYLGDEFYFEMGYPPAPPYDNIKQRVWTGQTSPLEKNPDDFTKANCLMEQPFVKDPKITIQDCLNSLVAKIGENIFIGRFTRYKVGVE